MPEVAVKKINMADDSIVIGADIGGSHITAARVNLARKQLIDASLVRSPVDSLAAAPEVIAQWAYCIKAAAGGNFFSKICLAMPGPFDYEAGICLIRNQAKYPMLYELNVKKLLAEELNLAAGDIYINNDAACFLQGEVFCGSMRGFDKAIGVTLGTGLGTAIYENGLARSADLWNMPFKESIAEDYLSTRWFLKYYAAVSNNTIYGVRELVALAPANNIIKSMFDEFGSNLAHFLTRFIAQTGARAVVIGGNIVQAFPLFKNALMTGIQNHLHDITIVPSALGEPAALIGAGSFWHHHSSTVL